MSKRLILHSLEKSQTICFPSLRQTMTLASPAIDFFTDFRYVKPLIIDSDIPIDQVEALMCQVHVHLKIVINRDNEIIGLISHKDLVGERPIQIEARQKISRSEIVVSDIMTPIKALKALRYSELVDTKISDVLEALKEEHASHFLVIDDESSFICGLISTSDIMQKLDLTNLKIEGNSFKSIFNSL